MNLGAASAGVAASGLIQHQTDATEQRLTGLADPAPRRVYLVDAVVMSRNALTTFKTKMALTGVVADTGDRDTEISSRTQSFARRDVPLHMPTDMSIRANNRVSFVDNKHRRGPPACLAPLYSKPAPRCPRAFSAVTFLHGFCMAKDMILLGEVTQRIDWIEIRCGRCARHGRLSTARLMAVRLATAGPRRS